MSKNYIIENVRDNNEGVEIGLPKIEEIENLKAGDFVYLSLIEEDNGEKLWVKVTENKDKRFKGEVVNDPVFIRSVKLGEIIDFQVQHILNFSTQEEQLRIVEAYKKQGSIPNQENTIAATIRLVEDYLEFCESDFEGTRKVFDMSKRDRRLFIKDIGRIRSKQSKYPKNSLKDASRLFLSLIFMIVIPQILDNFDNDDYDMGLQSSMYYDRLEQLLRESLRIYEIIAASQPGLLEDLKELNKDEDIEKLSSFQLPDFFGSFIDEAIVQVQSVR